MGAIRRGAAIRYVAQRANWDCGIAAIAMATDQTFDDVEHAISSRWTLDSIQRNGGLSTGHVAPVLGALGFAVQETFADEHTVWWEQMGGVRIANVHGHYIVLDALNRVHDPGRPGTRAPADYPHAFQVWRVIPVVDVPALCDLVDEMAKALEGLDAAAEHPSMCASAYDFKSACDCGLGVALARARAVLERIAR